MTTKNHSASLKILNNIGPEDSGEGKLSRRGFLKVLGSAAAVGAAGCADTAKKKVLPDVKGDMTRVPGVAQWFASSCTECSAGCGILIKTREGRATKVEGNPIHPVNRGGLCAIGQSSLQHTYDPDRVRQPIERTTKDGAQIMAPLSVGAADKKVAELLKKDSGKKRYFVSGPVHGAEQKLLKEWCDVHGVTHVVYSVSEEIALAEASSLVFGDYGLPEYSFKDVEAIVSFGADYLETWMNPCGYARDWAATRRGVYPAKSFHVEPRLSVTGSKADVWLKNKPGTELSIALAFLKLLLDFNTSSHISSDVLAQMKGLVRDVQPDKVAHEAGIDVAKLMQAARAVHTAKRSVVVSGGAAGSSPQEVQLHVATHFINMVLGNVGKTVFPGKRAAPQTDMAALKQVIADMNESAANVELLLLKDVNPVFSLPDSYGFKYAMKKVPLIVSFSSHLDETSSSAHLVLPSNTALEQWGDSSPLKGVYNLLQPSMPPVFDTRQFGDALIALAKASGKELPSGHASFLDALKANWQSIHATSGSSDSFETFWASSLERGGYYAAQSHEQYKVSVSSEAFKRSYKAPSFDSNGVKGNHLVLMPFPTVKSVDGRSSNRPWIQELPDPVTKIVWDVWAEIHPETAKTNKLKDGDFVQLSNYYGELNLPVHITPYVHPDVVAVPLGEGHTAYGRYANTQKGSNVFQLLPESKEGMPTMSTLVAVRRGPGRASLVNSQGSSSQYGRHIGRTKHIPVGMAGSVGHEHHGDHGHGHGHHEPKQMYDQRIHPTYEWGMAVDLAACTGCSACVVACYAENNIPVVGKEVCDQGREMSWLRIDRYFDGDDENPEVSYVPMMCQHCHNAPCEPVCPVYATYHTEQGLNAMVYNRCVGTRYCGNNCSYKVRRFNWFEYDWPEPLNWQLNPDVTKRVAGVMEKCTFCVQRINGGTNQAKNEGRMVRDGEIQPACVQSCPTEALTFGNLHDPQSKVSKLSKDSRAYKILDHHINTQPAVSYLENIKYDI